MKRSGPLRRTQGLRRTGGLRSRSAKTIARQPERDDCRAVVLARAAYRCEYEPLIPELPCAYYRWAGRGELEVDELHGGGDRCVEQYEPDACRAACPAHHDWKTDHKRELLRRLAAWEERRWDPTSADSSGSAAGSASPRPNATT